MPEAGGFIEIDRKLSPEGVMNRQPIYHADHSVYQVSAIRE